MIGAREKPALYSMPLSSQRSAHPPHPAHGVPPPLGPRARLGRFRAPHPARTAADPPRKGFAQHQAAISSHQALQTQQTIGTFFRKPYI